MSAIKQLTWRGAFLRMDPDLLQPDQAQRATNCYLDTMKLKALPEVSTVNAVTYGAPSGTTLPSSGRKTIYNYDWNGTDNWLSWANRVKVYKWPVTLDTYHRLLYTGDGLPKMRFVISSTEYTKDLGIPAPTAAATVATTTKSSTTWTRRWGWWYEDSAGNRFDVNTASLRWAAGQWTASGSEFYFSYKPGRKPAHVYENGTAMTEGAVGGLSAGQWGWDATNRQIYVKLSVAAPDPDPDLVGVLHYVTADWDYIGDSSTSDYLRLLEVTPGSRYQLPEANTPKGVEAPSGSRLVLYFTAHSDTGRIMGRVYPPSTVWEAKNDCFIDGAKVSMEYSFRSTLLTATYTYDIVYDTSDVSKYKADRVYVYTFVDQCGAEGPPSPASEYIGVLPNQNVTVSGLPTSQPTGSYNTVSYKRLYRSVTSDSGTAYQLCTVAWSGGSGTDIPLSAISSVTDSMLDIDAGETLPSEGWLPPPTDLAGLVAMPGGFFAGFSGKTVYFSEPNYPWAWPREYAVNVDADIADLAVFGNTCYVLTTDYPRAITCQIPGTVNVATIPSNQGMQNDLSISQGGAIFYASQDGLCMLSGMTVLNITEPYMEKTEWQAKTPSSAVIAVHDNWVYCFCSGGSFALRLGDAATGMVEFSDTPSAAYLFAEDDALYLVIGNAIKKWIGSASKRTFTWKSKKFLFPRPLDWRAVKVTASAYPVTVALYGDGTLLETISVTDDEARLIPKVRRSKAWEYTLSGSADVTEFVLSQSMLEI